MHTFTQEGESCKALFTKVRQTAEEQNFSEAAAGEDEKIAADVYRPIISIYGPRPVCGRNPRNARKSLTDGTTRALSDRATVNETLSVVDEPKLSSSAAVDSNLPD
jgi:hypothetical protein